MQSILYDVIQIIESNVNEVFHIPLSFSLNQCRLVLWPLVFVLVTSIMIWKIILVEDGNMRRIFKVGQHAFLDESVCYPDDDAMSI